MAPTVVFQQTKATLPEGLIKLISQAPPLQKPYKRPKTFDIPRYLSTSSEHQLTKHQQTETPIMKSTPGISSCKILCAR